MLQRGSVGDTRGNTTESDAENLVYHSNAEHDHRTINILVVEKASGMTPSHVVNPPSSMDAPIVSNVSITFSSLVAPFVS
jgi:hypothetical protein